MQCHIKQYETCSITPDPGNKF